MTCCDPNAGIFVFGSNLAGVHGAGAALHARQKHGAILGKGIGHHGDSYAIPTKDRQIQTLPLSTIQRYVEQFLEYARARPELKFFVTRIGCGLAGYTDKDIAPMFAQTPSNCTLPDGWRPESITNQIVRKLYGDDESLCPQCAKPFDDDFCSHLFHSKLPNGLVEERPGLYSQPHSTSIFVGSPTFLSPALDRLAECIEDLDRTCQHGREFTSCKDCRQHVADVLRSLAAAQAVEDTRECGRCGHTAHWHAGVEGIGECQVRTGCDCHEFKAPAGQGHAATLYYELLYEVGKKHPGESRHETARRYIRQQEAGCACTRSEASARPAPDREER
jgi:hypothetical protein